MRPALSPETRLLVLAARRIVSPEDRTEREIARLAEAAESLGRGLAHLFVGVAQRGAEVAQALGPAAKEQLPILLLRCLDRREAGGEALRIGGRWLALVAHGRRSPSAGSSTIECPWIFCCSFRMPWMRFSGRGGHPGMYTSTGTISSTPCTTE